MQTPAQEIARLTAFYSTLRGPTEAEVRLLTEAAEAGAVIVPSYWREYFGGQRAGLPIQFESCYSGLEPHTAHHVEATLKRDLFIERVRRGDLKALAERVSVERLVVTASDRKAA